VKQFHVLKRNLDDWNVNKKNRKKSLSTVLFIFRQVNSFNLCKIRTLSTDQTRFLGSLVTTKLLKKVKQAPRVCSSKIVSNPTSKNEVSIECMVHTPSYLASATSLSKFE